MSTAVVHTADGSCTLFSERCGDHYHSLHGAFTESDWIYIREGLLKLPPGEPARILEVGWGTGLNSILALRQAKSRNLHLHLDALEPLPPHIETISSWLIQSERIEQQEKIVLADMHRNREYREGGFSLQVINQELLSYITPHRYDLVFYDAFAPSKQPEMWQEACFLHVGRMMKEDAILLTYCAQGLFRRTLRNIGFRVEKVQGPPGKREITRAIKTNSFPLSH